MKKHWTVPPPTSDHPADQLRHFLACFPDSPDTELVKMSTSNVYDEGLVTGLTFGTLRALVKMLELYADLNKVLGNLRFVSSNLYESLRATEHVADAIANYPGNNNGTA